MYTYIVLKSALDLFFFGEPRGAHVYDYCPNSKGGQAAAAVAGGKHKF
jgi:hypothetical protein